MNMNQKGFANIMIIVLVVVFTGMAGYFVLRQRSQSFPINQPAESTKSSPSCRWFMGRNLKISQYETDERVLSECDNETFVELNHEYAKDKSFVYFRPMPNASFMTVILEGADPKTFELLERCPGLAADKSHVYQIGKVFEDKDPVMLKGGYIENNPKTYCY